MRGLGCRRADHATDCLLDQPARWERIVRSPRITHQLGAEPGYEWLYEVPLQTRGDVAICGTTTTRADAVAELARLCRIHRVPNPEGDGS